MNFHLKPSAVEIILVPVPVGCTVEVPATEPEEFVSLLDRHLYTL